MKLTPETAPVGARVLIQCVGPDGLLTGHSMTEARILEWSPSGRRVKIRALDTWIEQWMPVPPWGLLEVLEQPVKSKPPVRLHVWPTVEMVMTGMVDGEWEWRCEKEGTAGRRGRFCLVGEEVVFQRLPCNDRWYSYWWTPGTYFTRVLDSTSPRIYRIKSFPDLEWERRSDSDAKPIVWSLHPNASEIPADAYAVELPDGEWYLRTSDGQVTMSTPAPEKGLYPVRGAHGGWYWRPMPVGERAARRYRPDGPGMWALCTPDGTETVRLRMPWPLWCDQLGIGWLSSGLPAGYRWIGPMPAKER